MTTGVWSEADSASFIRFADFFVPEREKQQELISTMIGPVGSGQVLDLCSGPGALCGRLLADHEQARVVGLDASAAMLAESREVLSAYGDRFTAEEFDLPSADWRARAEAPAAVVSSLAIHHLDGPQKKQLYTDVHSMLAPGGAFVIADLIEPVGARATELARREWDEWVRDNALASGLGDEPYKAFHENEWSWLQYPDDLDKPSPLRDQLDWLHEIGFTDVDVYWARAGHAVFGATKTGERHDG